MVQQEGGRRRKPTMPGWPSRTPLDEAQEIAYDAWEASGRLRRTLARQALEISADCADAYVILAEETKSDQKALELYEQGVRAGERVIGPEGFADMVGSFWGILETRPYMRARDGLAQTLWRLGRQQEAVAHSQEMLTLNPSDNQGIRYRLASWLLEMGDDEALGELLTQYVNDATSDWHYNRALWLFRTQGASAQAEEALELALKLNPFVVSYLLGLRDLPDELPEYVSLGDESEAVSYVAAIAPAWYETDGAMEWFLSVVETHQDEDDSAQEDEP